MQSYVILFNFKPVNFFVIMLNNLAMFFSAGLLKPWQSLESRILSRLKIFRDFQSLQEGVEETRQKLLSFTERCRRKRRQKWSDAAWFWLKGIVPQNYKYPKVIGYETFTWNSKVHF
jgi:hypothetical protein